MTLRHHLILGIALLATVLGRDPHAQDLSERQVFVTVLDKDGQPIDGLTAEHFAIMESGRERKVLRVEPLRIPMHVMLLVDTSGIGADEAFRSAISDFAGRLAVFNQVAIYGFGDRPVRIVEFTQDAGRIREAITALTVSTTTRSLLIDGVDRALQDMAIIETARPVIVAISAEAPEASGKSAGSVIKKLISQSTAFHVVSLGARAGSTSRVGPMTPAGIAQSSQALTGLMAAGEGDRERTQLLRQGTAATGGSEQRITSTLALKDALHRVATQLSNAYRLTFSRPGSDRVRDLQVGIFLEGVTVKTTPAPFGTR